MTEQFTIRIGNFWPSPAAPNRYHGYIRTLTIDLPAVAFAPRTEDPNTYDVIAKGKDGGFVDMGIAWKRAKAELSVLLLAPEIPNGTKAHLGLTVPTDTDMILTYDSRLGKLEP